MWKDHNMEKRVRFCSQSTHTELWEKNTEHCECISVKVVNEYCFHWQTGSMRGLIFLWINGFVHVEVCYIWLKFDFPGSSLWDIRTFGRIGTCVTFPSLRVFGTYQFLWKLRLRLLSFLSRSCSVYESVNIRPRNCHKIIKIS